MFYKLLLYTDAIYSLNLVLVYTDKTDEAGGIGLCDTIRHALAIAIALEPLATCYGPLWCMPFNIWRSLKY